VAPSLHLSNRNRQLNTNIKLEFDCRFARFRLEVYSSLYLIFPDLVRLGLVPAAPDRHPSTDPAANPTADPTADPTTDPAADDWQSPML
jgi:hypothetical protein